jgi:SAM-dependent methyltransferase
MGDGLILALKRRYWSARKTLRRRRDRIFDETQGVDTAGYIELTALRTIDVAAKPFGAHYLPSPVAFVRKLLRGLNIRYESYVFVDLGSGKGRVLLLAAELPFKEIIGVEFSPELHAIARSNIARSETITGKGLVESRPLSWKTFSTAAKLSASAPRP